MRRASRALIVPVLTFSCDSRGLQAAPIANKLKPMNPNYLDFEQPIAELQAKIEELRLVGSDSKSISVKRWPS